jgi:hypothetical protein
MTRRDLFSLVATASMGPAGSRAQGRECALVCGPARALYGASRSIFLRTFSGERGLPAILA